MDQISFGSTVQLEQRMLCAYAQIMISMEDITVFGQKRFEALNVIAVDGVQLLVNGVDQQQHRCARHNVRACSTLPIGRLIQRIGGHNETATTLWTLNSTRIGAQFRWIRTTITLTPEKFSILQMLTTF